MRAFAYPNGRPRVDYNETTLALLGELGFDFAFTMRPSFATPDEPPFERSRFLVLAEVTAPELAHRRLDSRPWPQMERARICVVTAGHVSTTPRMLKAADALHGAGYQVRVVSANHTPWATETDRVVMATRRLVWRVVDYSRTSARAVQVGDGGGCVRRRRWRRPSGRRACRCPSPFARTAGRTPTSCAR